MFHGWKCYYENDVREAGLGMAMLYMTVLGFDNITWGYCRQQGVSESVLGALTGVSALVGVAGARLYPVLLRKFGINKTGLTGFSFQSLCLTLCVISVWAPGSPFILAPETSTIENGTSRLALASPDGDNSSHLQSLTHDQILPSDDDQDMVTVDNNGCYVSVTLLLVGIILSRLGLWLADLSVHQIFQQRLEDHNRGSICGVQTGLQSFMDLVKFVLVIVLPHPDKFGFLIILSFLVTNLDNIHSKIYIIFSTFIQSISGGGFLFLKFKIQTEKTNNRTESDTLLPCQGK